MYDEKNTDCALYCTEECALLNSESCLACSMGKLKPEEQQQMHEALKKLREAAPPEEVEPLYTSDECLLCKGEGSRGKTECYALFDLAKDEEGGDWTFKLIKRSKSKAMLLPLQVCSCKKCRSRYRLLEYLPTLAALLIAGGGLYIIAGTDVFKQATELARWLPAALYAAILLIAVIAYFMLRHFIRAAVSQKTELDVTCLPAVTALMQNGWYEVNQTKSGVSKLVFANKPRKYGIYTAKPAEKDEVPQIGL